MRIVCISDTHGQHDRLRVPDGDVLVHAGDFTEVGERGEVALFLQWLAKQPHAHKILIGGNHEFYLEEHPEEFRRMVAEFPDITYLQDSGTEIAGVRFWGSPVSPRFQEWAFLRDRGPSLRVHWDLIPRDVNVLVTHAPPAEIGDRTPTGVFGCGDLLEVVGGLPDLRLHVFGHIHPSFGMYERGGVTFVNASMLTARNALRDQAPPIFDYPDADPAALP